MCHVADGNVAQIFSGPGTIMILVHLIRNEHMSISRIFLFAVARYVARQLASETPAPATLVTAGRLHDPRTRNVLSPAAMLIENDKIKEVGAPAHVQANAPAA